MISVSPLPEEEKAGLLAFMRPIWEETYAFLPREQIDLLLMKYFSPEGLCRYGEMGYEYFRVSDGEHWGILVIREREGDVYLDKLYFPPSARGRGLASAAFAFLEKRGKPILLNVNQKNLRAIRCYEKNGFRRVSEERIDLGRGLVNVDFVYRREAVREDLS
jgi:ribosomal protein S18 acetylase RimI-like enzyme